MSKKPKRLDAIDPAATFDRGLSFEYAAVTLITRDDLMWQHTVAAVNMALATELYLKTLAKMDRKLPYKVHDLVLLFEDLPRSTRASLDAHWDAAFDGERELVRLGNEQYLFSLPLSATPPLAGVVDEHRKLFEAWRYPEPGSWMNVAFRLPTPFRREILQRQPGWTPPDTDAREKVLRTK